MYPISIEKKFYGVQMILKVSCQIVIDLTLALTIVIYGNLSL